MSKFKIGDKVVFKNEPIIRSIIKVFKINDFDGDNAGQICKFEKNEDDLFWGYEDQLRLATIAEIKTGHRIDANNP